MRSARSLPAPPGGGFVGTNVPYIISRSSIPFIWVSSGSIGNNGALTAITALPQVYLGGGYIWLPAGAIATGVPAAAAWYWCVFSSTTAGTIYNSTYTSGTPAVGVQTAFVTTGPGAFTGSIAAATGPSITLPGGCMGPNGRLRARLLWATNGGAGSKTAALALGATTFYSEAVTAPVGMSADITIANRGSQSIQQQAWFSILSSGAIDGNIKVSDVGSGAIDTSANAPVALNGTRNTATDNLILASYELEVAYGA